VETFKAWFTKQPNIKHNTVTTYMGRLRTIFNHAVSNELITKTPIPKGSIAGYKKGKQVALTVDELLRFKNIPDAMLTPSMQQVKYCFLFMCSTGMGYGELKSLRLHHIGQDENEYTIKKDRNKSGVEFSLPLSPTAKDIYVTFFTPQRSPSKVEPFADLPSIEYVTRKVKVLAAMAGIDKNITTYVGRKSFATQWANDNNNIYFLSKILGHKKIDTTMKYVNLSETEMMEYTRKAYTQNAFHTPVSQN
jgi:integrase